jgi:hypothetical protein
MFSYTPYRRSHHSIFCNCQLCKQFDYADTVVSRSSDKTATRQKNRVSPVSVRLYELQLQPASPISSGVYEVELFHAYDTETSERYDYALVSKIQ